MLHSRNSLAAGRDRRGGPDAAAETTTCTLQYWIASNRSRDDCGICEQGDKNNHLEKSVCILYSLVGKILDESKRSKDDSSNDGVIINPNFIAIENVIVTEQDGAAELSADFVERGDSIFFNANESGVDDEAITKYLAMNALGRIAYEICMPEDGNVPKLSSVPKVCSHKSRVDSTSNARRITNDNALSANQIVSLPSNAWSIPDKEDITLDEQDALFNLLKNPHINTSEVKDSSGLIPTMLGANIPFPLARFISDLLENEHEWHSFSSFIDVLSDLKQMVDNPNDFLHASSPDRWKLVFGDKLYGRDGDTKAFMDAADRVATVKNDPLIDGLIKLTGRKKREVVMVSGHSGAGKSQLVKSGGALLEKKGWRFLKCKFDRVVHPEPISILAYAFEEFFASFGCRCHRWGMSHLTDFQCSCSGLHEICQRLRKIISHEGIEILAKHIPYLHSLPGVTLPTATVEISEPMMASLFHKLLQAISSKKTPIVFFIDDLQWADPLSFALLTVLVQGANPEYLHPASTNGNNQTDCNGIDLEESEIQIMFAGSYRDNEVNGDHTLSKILSKFESDSSINMTNISLSRFTPETLNEMLSDVLCVPTRRVRALSKLVIQKTDGQPLHIIVFVQALAVKKLLTHSFTRGWEWDTDSIDICSITHSVAEIYTFHLKRLAKDVLLGLQILSCFGSQIDQNVLRFVTDYDDENSVDISVAIEAAASEGYIERAAQLILFAHDMIQKATIDSIQSSDLVPLLRKLAAALIRNASAVGELNSVLFVVVDLTNRIGSDATSFPAEQALFAELNLRAGSKAMNVPDFAAAAKYAENGISFLSDNCWEAQYELSLRLSEIAVLSHFSSIEGDRNLLTKRINAVLNHAKDFPDCFMTHCVWVKVLSMEDIPRAIEESLTALESLGEPLDLADVDINSVCDEIVKLREQFSGDGKKRFLSTNRLHDCSKVRAMKIMSPLMAYYHQTKPFMMGFIACRMIKMSIDFGHSEDSVIGAAGFACCLITMLGDIDEGSAWGNMTLSLMKEYDRENLIPSIYSILYGIVFVWKEPIQSTLEPLAEGISTSFATGNIEYAVYNARFYVARSLHAGKNISVLTGELETFARQYGNHFGHNSTSDKPVYSPFLQFSLTPLYNVLQELKGGNDISEEEESLFPFDKVTFTANDEIMQAALEKDLNDLHGVLIFQTIKEFVCRDMENALKCTDLYCEHFLAEAKRLEYTSITPEFYEALITFYFMRQTGEEKYLIRGENAMCKIKEWSVHSDWNFKNKVLLVEAEWYNIKKGFDKAALCYEASIRAAHQHRFVQEEAIASELAGIFFLERGLLEKSQSFFEHSMKCYQKWGAFTAVKRIEDMIRNTFGSDCIHWQPHGDLFGCMSADIPEEKDSKKRQPY